ncbi:MAG: DEAD/DEAH box helicase [Nanoarchaeota archaeon]|nr:DEAD/DEAH box helicase [Nanoarchaeota archaeon]
MTAFEKLNISKEILKVIEEEAFKRPTLIQEKAIPIILEGKDIIGKSATGTGKTLAFACGIIQDCVKNEGIQALVLLPTRELANQVGSEIKKYAKYTDLNVATIFGGKKIESEFEKVKNSEILVGTPGRVMDHLKRKTLDLSFLKILVLDEADLLIENDFIEDVSFIIENCNEERQDMLFSATFSEKVQKLAKTYMNNPILVESKHKEIEKKKLNQFYYLLDNNQKLSLLIYFLKNYPSGLNIVFANRQESAKIIWKNIKAKTDLNAEILHSDVSQGKRNRIMKSFKNQEFDVLVTTDIAGRGLDVDNVSHIYNYSIPSDAKKYIHRIGRTARAGASGTVINFISENDEKKFLTIVNDFKIKCNRKQLPQFEEIEVKSIYDKKKKNKIRREKAKENRKKFGLE